MNIYVVKNKEGKYFRAKGRGGYSSQKSWVDDIADAKFYTKIGQAKSRCSFFYNNYPEYGCPNIIEFILSNYVILNVEEEVNKNILKRKKASLVRDLRYKSGREMEIRTEISKLEAELAELK